MKYLSFDLEATGLEEDCLIIEFAMIPFCSVEKKVNHGLAREFYIKCPSFEDLKDGLNPWVRDNMKSVIDRAHSKGIPLKDFKNSLIQYLESPEVTNYFQCPKDRNIVLFGKSVNAIDLPFLNRDLGWDFMRKYFHHQALDLSGVAYSLVDQKKIPSECISGSELMKFLKMGEVEHTALADAVNTANMYLKLLEICS